MNEQEILEFPCQFPIKIVGENSPDLEIKVLSIILKYVPTLAENAIKTRLSKNNRFLSITVTITATSKAQLDAIYQELSQEPLVHFTL